MFRVIPQMDGTVGSPVEIVGTGEKEPFSEPDVRPSRSWAGDLVPNVPEPE